MKKLFIILATIALALPVASMASAAVIVYDFNIEFSGATPPAGGTPWLRATIDDGGSAGSVSITMQAVGLVGVEFVDDWLFNLDPSFSPGNLVFAVDGASTTGVNSISTGVDAFQADGDGKFDILFDFPPPPGTFAAKFTTGEIFKVNITSTDAIVASSFQFGSAPGGGQGTYFSAAHVQGIGTDGAASGWVAPTIPEPSSLLLVGLGVGVLGLLARRRQ